MTIQNSLTEELFGTSMCGTYITSAQQKQASGEEAVDITKTKGVAKEPGPAPGPAPRIGLKWNKNSHRWVKDVTPKEPERKYPKIELEGWNLSELPEMGRTEFAKQAFSAVKDFYQKPNAGYGSFMRWKGREDSDIEMIWKLFDEGKDVVSIVREVSNKGLFSDLDNATNKVQTVLDHQQIIKNVLGDQMVTLYRGCNGKSVLGKGYEVGDELEIRENRHTSRWSMSKTVAMDFYYERKLSKKPAILLEITVPVNSIRYCDIFLNGIYSSELEVAVINEGLKAKVIQPDTKKTSSYMEQSRPIKKASQIIDLDPDEYNWLSGLRNDGINKSESPGPPPRPGLQWKPTTSRWIRPESPHRDKLAMYVKQQRMRERIPNLQGVAPANTTALVKYLTEQIPENASKFYGMLDWLEQYAKLALQGTDTSNEFVDDLYKKTNKAYKKIWKPSVLRSFFDEADKHPSRLNKVIAIDAFAHTAHDRGSILPHVFMETLERPKDAQAVGFNYEWSVLSNMDDVVGGIFDEIYMRENISPETKSARESLFNYIQQTKNHSYGRDDLNAWVNKGEFEDVGVELLTETSGIDKVYARKASDLMPDPYSIGFYDWVEKTLDLGGSQIKGVKETGRQIEADLYSSLKKACNKYLDSVTPDMMQHEIINGLSSVVEKWTRDQSISMSEAFDKLYKAGLYAGALDAGVKRASNLADELVLRLLKTDPNRLGARIKLFSKDVIERFNKIISNAYTAEGEFWLPGMMKEMMEVVPAQRYQIERIVRTEVASISNAGRLYGWSQDPLKYYNDYMWNATYDNRAKFISLFRANQNPLTYDEAKFLWENQAQIFNGRIQNDTFNQRCSLTRRPIEFERKGNRWDGDSSFIQTMQLGF